MAKSTPASRRRKDERLRPVRAIWLRPAPPLTLPEATVTPTNANQRKQPSPPPPLPEPAIAPTNANQRKQPSPLPEPTVLPTATQDGQPSPPRRAAWLAPAGLVTATAAAGWLVMTQLPALLHPVRSAVPVVAQGANSSTGPATPREGIPIDYRSFSDLTGLFLAGSAIQSGVRVRLTDGAASSGAVWSAYPLDPAASFSTAFRVTTGRQTGTFSFVLRTTADDSQASLSELNPRVSVDFDVHAVDGASSNHLTIAWSNQSEAATPTPVELNLDDRPLTVWIDYRATSHTLQIYVAFGAIKPAEPQVTLGLDVAGVLGAGPAHAGFIASTSEVAQTHDLLAWHLWTAGNARSSPTPQHNG